MENPKDLTGQMILGYHVEEQIGSGGFGTVYKVSKTNVSGEFIYAMKHITIPTEMQYNDVLSSMGGDYSKADNYFTSVLTDIIHEINILSSLSEKNSNHVVIYYDNEIVKQESPLRYDIYIRMEYLTPLTAYARTHEMKVMDILDLGIDILSALDLCHSNHIIHRDIKDDNIFVNKDGKCKLGDFGIAKVLKDTSRAASVKGTPAFIAPEVYSGQEEYSHIVDLYSLGIVLYKLLNYSRLPFLPDYPATYEMDDVDRAIGRRLLGEIPDRPANARNELGDTLVKAISSKENRFKNAKEFSDALVEIKHRLPREELERVINKHIVVATANHQTKRPNSMGFRDASSKDYDQTIGANVLGNASGKQILGDKYTNTIDHINNKDLFKSVGATPIYSTQNVAAGAESQARENLFTMPDDPLSRPTEKIYREYTAPIEKKDFIWAIYLAPVIIGLIGIILFFAVVPQAIGKLIPLNDLLAGNFDKMLSVNNLSSLLSKKMLVFRALFYLIFVAFVTSLFFVGKQLQKKKEPNALGAILRGKEPYFKMLVISGSMNEARRTMRNNADVNKMQERIKRLEEQLKSETDFGCGNDQITDCENDIAEKIRFLTEIISSLSNDEQLTRKLHIAEKTALSLVSLLRIRREMTITKNQHVSTNKVGLFAILLIIIVFVIMFMIPINKSKADLSVSNDSSSNLATNSPTTRSSSSDLSKVNQDLSQSVSGSNLNEEQKKKIPDVVSGTTVQTNAPVSTTWISDLNSDLLVINIDIKAADLANTCITFNKKWGSTVKKASSDAFFSKSNDYENIRDIEITLGSMKFWSEAILDSKGSDSLELDSLKSSLNKLKRITDQKS
ncbi:serine/threonine-protein kinase [Paenibacillus andongensis]|uniref:serine/threonine-protein kinase n=1 Tax=Paenibacillus andongensis TaxID=2975482 RepID=UPI0021BB4251|nr:serine/threonine-protein kinase [Paenibacillus andongensis]